MTPAPRAKRRPCDCVLRTHSPRYIVRAEYHRSARVFGVLSKRIERLNLSSRANVAIDDILYVHQGDLDHVDLGIQDGRLFRAG